MDSDGSEGDEVGDGMVGEGPGPWGSKLSGSAANKYISNILINT